MIETPPSEDPSGETLQRTALQVSMVASFLAPFMVSAVNIALPAIGKEFALPTGALGWVATSYLLAAAVCLIPAGRLADLRGRKKVFLWGAMAYALSALLAAFTPGAAWLIAFRVAQGVSAAMISGTGLAILTSVYPAAERGKVLGINVASTYTGLSVGPALGGLMTHLWGWRSVFLFNAAAGALLLALVAWRLKGEWAEARGEGFDRGGAVLSALLLLALLMGFSRLPGADGAGLIAAGALALPAFVRWERRAAFPLLPVGLFRNPVFAFSNLAALIHYSATFAVGFLLSLHLQYVKGMNPRAAGFVLLAQPVVQALFSPLAGRLSDRIEARTLASAGMGLSVIGLLGLCALHGDTSTAPIVGILMLLGLGFALFSSPNTHAVMGAVEKRFYGVASGTLGAMRLTGQTLSIGVVQLIFTLRVGDAPLTPARHPVFLAGMRTALLVFALLCLAGVAASLARGRMRPETAPGDSTIAAS